MSHELDLLARTLKLIDDTLAQPPRAKEIVDEAYQQEADLEADRQLDEQLLQRHDQDWPYK